MSGDETYKPTEGYEFTPVEGRRIYDLAQTYRILRNPFAKGDEVVIGKGTPFRYRGEDGYAKRKCTVKVHACHGGYVNQVYRVGRDRWTITQPVLVTVGSGGYWKDYAVTEFVCTDNGKPVEYEVYNAHNSLLGIERKAATEGDAA